MSDDSFRNGKIVFTKGVVYCPQAANSMEYSAALPLDYRQLKEITEGFENSSLALKDMSGYIESGIDRLHFDNIYELKDFLDYTENLVDGNEGNACNEKFRAALELEGFDSIEKARHIVDNLDGFDYFPGISSYDELGVRLLEDMMPDKMYDALEWVLDVETYGRDYYENNDYGCCFASTGYIQKNDSYIPFEHSQIEPMM